MPQYTYLHIPKTAGTSLVNLMAAKFGQRFRQTDPGGMFWYRPYLGEFDCISGHIPFFMLAMEDRPREVLCLLRRPIDRVLSAINHFLSEAHHPVHQVLTGGLVDMTDLFHTMPFAMELCNLQTRMLGLCAPRDLIRKARAGDYQAFQELDTSYVLSEVNSEHLERAKSTIETGMQIGIFEHLDYSVSQVLGDLVPSASAVPHLRAPTRRTETPRALLQTIADANRLDLLLYDFALEHFLQRAARQVLAKGELIDLPGAPRAFRGLHYLERHQGEHLRWTDGDATLDICAPAEADRIDLSVKLWDLNGTLERQNVKMTLDGVPVDPAKGEGQFAYDASWRPARAGSVRCVRLAITSTTVTFSGDPRTLGVAIRSIAVKPAAP